MVGYLTSSYRDFSGGLNDTSAALSMDDNELPLAENVEFSAEVKAFRTRRGCVAVNTASFGADVTDGYSWTVGSRYRKCVVAAGKVYQIDSQTGAKTEKISLTPGAKEIYPFTVHNILYFGDGSELYAWGSFDYSTEQGTKTIVAGDIVRNNDSPSGVTGNFYRAVGNLGSVNLKTENYTNTSRWTDVTDVNGAASNVVRPVKPYDPSRKEIVKITVIRGADAEGTVTLSLNATDFKTEIAAGDDVSTVVTKLLNTATAGWTKEKNGNAVIYTKNEAGLSENGYFDPSSTGVSATMETVQEGRINDNDLSPIRKCTMFVLHPSSARVFAAGNSDDNGLYYSEIGVPTYFNSAINKVYPSNGYGRVTAIGLLSRSVIVSYEDGWYSWDGITPLAGEDPARWMQLNIPAGCVCHQSLALTPNSFTYLGKDGIYMVSASILNDEIVMLQGKDVIQRITANRIDNTMNSIADKTRCRAVFDRNIYYLAFNTLEDQPPTFIPFNTPEGQPAEITAFDAPSNPVINTRVIKYELDTKSFSIVTGWRVNQWIRDSENLYFASFNYLMEANKGYSDANIITGEPEPIHVHVKTKEFDLGNAFAQKVCQHVGLIFKQGDTVNDSKENIALHSGYHHYKVNGVEVSESLVYGRTWGHLWGFREAVTIIIEYIAPSNTFQIEFENNRPDDPVTLIAIGFVYQRADYLMPTHMKDEELLR
jgi:hypothetical protein